jgi:hypothetical protein
MDLPPIPRSAAESIAALDRAADLLRSSPLRRGCCVHLPPFRGRGRLLATGDLHDNPIHLQKILALARLDRSPDHHVTLHELIHGEKLVNGMDLSHRMLLRIAALIEQFPAQVHPLLANHELSQMTGVGVSKGAGNSVELFNDGLAYAFRDDWPAVAEAANRFIRAMPLALAVDVELLCAHSLPPPRLIERFDPAVLERELTDADYDGPAGAAYAMVWGRGHAPADRSRLAELLHVKMFILGHEHVETGIEVREPNTIVLNSDHDRACVLPIDLSQPPDAAQAVMHAIPLAAI